MDLELEKLLDDLKPTSKPALNSPISTLQPTISSQPMPRLTSDKLDDFVMHNASNIIQDGVDLIRDIKDSISQAIDPDEVSALADIIKATNGSLDVLNKMSISNKKMGIKTDSHVINNSGNTNIFVGTREDAMKNIINKKKDVDVEYTEVKQDVPALNETKKSEEIIDVPVQKEEEKVKPKLNPTT